MWQQESGCMEMFLAYYKEFEENVADKKSYRDFLFEVLCLHERSTYGNHSALEEVGAELSKPEIDCETEELLGGSDSSSVFLSAAVSQLETNFFGRVDAQSSSVDAMATVENSTFSGWQQTVVKQEYDMNEMVGPNAAAVCSEMEVPQTPYNWDPPTEAGLFASDLVATSFRSGSGQPKQGKNVITRPKSREAYRFKCKYCSRSFVRKGHVVIHERIHTGERPYACQFCGKTFIRTHDVVRHTRIHTGEKPYRCQVCGEAFTNRSDMVTHTSEPSKCRFQCRICLKTFVYKSSWLYHEQTHSSYE